MNTNAPTTPSAAAFKSGIARVFVWLAASPKLLWLILPVVAAVSFLAFSASTAPVIPAINLSADPLYAAATGDKPALALALSVEYPTVGAQYVSGTNTDNSYTNTNEYLGYYDAESCYRYNDNPTETPVSPQTTTDFKRFDRTGAALGRKCTNAFSGNFLNWASSSAIDMLRLALTGGDRYIDTSTLTILQRAVIPNGNPICMWNSSNFPAKQLRYSGGSSGTAYFGAVPTAMATAAGNSDIWVGNTLNRIYFGTAAGGSCGDTSSYTLGNAVSSSEMGSVVYSNDNLPGDVTVCTTGEGQQCSFTGIKEVWYGAEKGRTKKWNVFPASNGVLCANSVIGDPYPNEGKKCYIRPYSGLWTPTASTGGLNSDGFFYSRVQVCNVASGVLQDSRDYDFCKKYPNGNFKPTGAVQKYSDQLRLAAFGYLMDQTASYNSGGRYGGVLRAPIKYVGGKTFDDNGIDNTPTGGNPKAEWSERTGEFNNNSENDATYGKSGVVTYLNQFGRTGDVPGRYKIYDPVGELHYEALRYLQGLQPSTDAISNITADMYDGFPVTTTWTDPYGGTRTNTADYSCLKSNIVVIGDINTHDGNRTPTANTASNIPDINAWRTVVQNFEMNLSSVYIDGQGVSRTTSNPNGANNSVPSGPSTSQIMGSAYWAHTHDIRGTGWTGTGGPAKQRQGLRVKTFTFDVNEYGDQTNATTRRNANQFFMASKYGGFETDPLNPSKNPYNTKGNPFYRDDLTTVDKYVWEDTDASTARTGEANTYFLQSNARGVLKAFDDIFARASTSARSIAGAAVQSKNLIASAGNVVYQGAFDTSDWTGDLLALPVSVTASTATPPNVVTISSIPTWSAATQLAAMATPATTRKIVVGKVGATANPVATPFTWTGIEASLLSALDKATPTSAADGLAHDRLDYLRGDSAKENNPFRKRNKLLGDIINSGVAYSGLPATNISGSGYAAFQTSNASRTAAVFVGANDGMLHAFNATNGNELFAYIPSWLGPKLPALTAPTYVNNHQSFMDGTPVVAEAQVASSWKTVLIAGTGGGGQGVFALDVTNPAAFDENKVMWEFTHADDPDMGNVIGRPQILKLRTSAYGDTATYKWFAVVGSGVNNYVADSTGLFGSGYPALFLLDLAKPAGTAWTLGTNYYKISVPVNGNLDYLTAYIATGGTSLTASKATGLINFKATLGNAREVAQIYLGDLHGQLWKLDFSLLGTADWNMKKLSPFKTGTAPYPLYIAKDASANVQPITMPPSIANGPIPGTRYVLFGTGKYLETSDKITTSNQSVYMVYDNASSSADTSPAGESAISSRLRLKQGTANASTGAITVPAFTLGRAVTNIDTEVIRSGWYFDLPTSGERQISAAIFSGNSAIFGSMIPGSASASGSCIAGDGGGNLYEVNFASGNGKASASTVGLLGEPLVMEITGATTSTPTDNTGRRLKTVTSRVMPLGSNGVSAGVATTKTVITGRLSWRQINNFQDLKHAP